MVKHVIIYSHGFGVRADARGIFPAIEAALPEAVHVMFDYNTIDERGRLLVPPIPEQVARLQRHVNTARGQYPDAEIIVVAHSFGCVIAGLADLSSVHKVVLLAPPIDLEKSTKRLRRLAWPRLRFTLRGEITLRRRDGVIVVITPAYRKSRKGIRPLALYNQLAKRADVTVVGATHDRLLGTLDVSGLVPAIKCKWIDGSHNFSGEAREEVASFVAKVVRTS